MKQRLRLASVLGGAAQYLGEDGMTLDNHQEHEEEKSITQPELKPKQVLGLLN